MSVVEPEFSDTVVLNEINKYDWNTDIVKQIIQAESGFNQLAHNGRDNHKTCIGSYGYMQIGCLHFKEGEDPYNTAINIQRGYEVYVQAGRTFRPWGVCTNGAVNCGL